MSARITAKRVAAIQRQLHASEERIIEHLATAKLLTGRQLRSLTDSITIYQRRALQRDLKHLTDLRVLARLNRRIGGIKAGSDSFVYALDVVGQRIVHPEPRRQWRAPWTPSIRIVAHALAVSDLYVRLHNADQHHQFELLHFATEPHCWRSFTGPGGGRLILKPDAHVVVGTTTENGDSEHHAWIEVDRNTESLTWITEKAKTYARYHTTGREQATQGVFPICLWIAPDEQRAAGLSAALARLPAEHWHLHQVTTTDHALRALTGDQPDEPDQHHVIEGTTP